MNFNFGEVFTSPIISKRRFLASATSRDATEVTEVSVAQRMGVAANSVAGTAGNDTIVINNTNDRIQVSINSGPVQSFDISSVKLLVIDSGAGEDTVTINGTANAELAHFQSTLVGLRREDVSLVNPLGYGILAKNSERVIVNAGTGPSDLAVFQDSPGSDTVVASGNSVMLTAGNGLATAQSVSFDKVRLISTLGGTDTVNEQTIDFALEQLGDWK